MRPEASSSLTRSRRAGRRSGRRRDREVAALVVDLVAAVAALLAAGVPGARDGVDRVEAGVLLRLEADVVEDVELGLRGEERRVADAGRGEVRLGLLAMLRGSRRVGLAGERVVDEEVDDQRLGVAERVEVRRGRVGEQRHVRLVDGLEAADRRAVERSGRRRRPPAPNEDTGTVKCCMTPGRSQNRTSTNSTPSSLTYLSSSSRSANICPPWSPGSGRPTGWLGVEPG